MASQTELMKQDGYLTTAEAAEAIGVDITTVYRWVKADRVTGVKLGGSMYILADDLLEMYAASPSIQERIKEALEC